MSNSTKSALLVVDIQNDFCSGGNLEVPNSLTIIPKINRIKEHFKKKKMGIVIYSKDWHPPDHVSFEKSGGKFPPHCIQYQPGAELHNGLDVDERDFIIHKGTNPKYESSSAFYDSKIIGFKTNLSTILEDNNVNKLYVCGIAAEYCVYSTLLDAVKDRYQRYKCFLIEDATVGLDEVKIKERYEHLKKLGVKIIDSSYFN